MRPDDFVCLEPCRLFLLLPDVIIGPGGPMGHRHPYNCSMGAHEARADGRRRASDLKHREQNANMFEWEMHFPLKKVASESKMLTFFSGRCIFH